MKLAFLVAPLMALPLASVAHADRAPSPGEAAAIADALYDQGFTRWDEIELDADDGVWEVDDAVAMDGQRYDLDLSITTLDIVKSERD